MQMKLVVLVALSLCLTTVALAATPSAAACRPPSCPGWGGCRVDGGDLYVDMENLGVYGSAPHFECYY